MDDRHAEACTGSWAAYRGSGPGAFSVRAMPSTASLMHVTPPCLLLPCSGGKTGAKAIAAAEAQAAGLAAAADAEKLRAAAAERRNTDDAVVAARARYLARKAAGGKGR